MDDRDQILQRLRAASNRDIPPDAEGPRTRPEPVREKELLRLFTERLQAVGGLCIPASEKSIADQINMLLSISGSVFIDDDPALRSYDLAKWHSTDSLADAETAVTACDGLVAETGTVILAGGSHHRRTASLLPPRHIVIAQKKQLYQNSEEFFRYWEIDHEDWPDTISAMVFITGPSRTADIEKVLIQGMHGPKELVVLLLE